MLLAAQQGTLLELLDAPQLMDTCVRNGIYDEALDLHAFIMRVSLLHPDMPIVKLLASQVRSYVRVWTAEQADDVPWLAWKKRTCLSCMR